jgi:tetratricopeptide (TPR) repeat protein
MRLAIDHFIECRGISRQFGFGRIEVGSNHMIGTVRRYLLECREAIDDLRTSVDMAVRVGNLRTEMVARTILGETLVDAGDLQAAYDQLSSALALADTMGNRRYSAYIYYELGRALWNDPDRQLEAQQILMKALAIGRETGLNFVGPRTLAALAMATSSPFRFLEEGEAILRSGCLAHNALWFYRDAIEACLGAAAWHRADHYANELRRYTNEEPLPWADLFIARGRALAALGRGQRDAAIAGELRRIEEQASRVGIRLTRPASLHPT